jgi:hypothetical protein
MVEAEDGDLDLGVLLLKPPDQNRRDEVIRLVQSLLGHFPLGFVVGKIANISGETIGEDHFLDGLSLQQYRNSMGPFDDVAATVVVKVGKTGLHHAAQGSRQLLHEGLSGLIESPGVNGLRDRKVVDGVNRTGHIQSKQLGVRHQNAVPGLKVLGFKGTELKSQSHTVFAL